MLYRFGEFVLDTARLELFRGREQVPVEPQIHKLLICLIENRDRVVSRTELIRFLWGKRIVTENSLNTCVKSARQAIGDTGRVQSKIRTIPRLGYRFVADVRVSAHVAAEAGQAIEQDGPGIDLSRTDSQWVSESIPITQPSIVVLPFENIDNGGSGSIFARGLVHDVITRIARSRTMFIIARGTAFQFSGGGFDVKTIAEKLGVRFVAQGAVQISGNKVKVTAVLASAMTRQEIWSQQYDYKLDDFMEIQEEVADRIVSALETHVEHHEAQRSLLMPSSNLDAWSAYHRGLHHMYTFRPEDCDRAEYFFRRSIDLESDMPRPYAGLSFVNFERVFLGLEQNRNRGIQRAFDYAMRSLTIDPLDPMGHWTLARAYLIAGKLEESKKELETAIELNPSYAIAQYSLGWVAMQLGDNELCRDRIALARRLSPYDPLKFAMLGVYALNLALMGQTQEAADLAEQSIRQPNAHHLVSAFAAVTHALDGRMDRARSIFRDVRAVVPDYDADDFLSVFPFQLDRDIKAVNRVFYDLKHQPRTH